MPSGGSSGRIRASFIASGTPAAYSEISVRETYEDRSSSPGALQVGLQLSQDRE